MSLLSQTFWPKVDKKIWLIREPFFGWRMHFSSNIFFLRSAKNEQKNSSTRKHRFKAGSEEYVFLQLWHIPNCLYLLFSFFFLHLHSWTWRISVFVHSRELTYQRERDTVCEYMPALSIRLANKLMVYLQE